MSGRVEAASGRSACWKNGVKSISGIAGLAEMKLGFEEAQSPYTSGTQSARVWTERWVRDQMYCPNCGVAKINAFPNNSPVAETSSAKSCKEEFELESQKSVFRTKVLDGAFRTKCDRLAASNNPSLFLLNYNRTQLSVVNLMVVPKHFFVREIIEERKPLKANGTASGLDRLIYLAKSGSDVR